MSVPRITPETLYAVVEATWPPASTHVCGPFTLRQGAGGGKRVSAATARAAAGAQKRMAAEDAMRAMGQAPLFMIRAGEDALDASLAEAGYAVIDPVKIYIVPTGALTSPAPPRTATFHIWPPLEIQREIWASGGIDAARLDVMSRSTCAKTAILGRDGDRPAGTGYVALHEGIAMVHAIEVLPQNRRRSLGRYMMQEAALWAKAQGAGTLAVICTEANTAANALYAELGMTLAARYHYRHLPQEPVT
ncbi:GNAT family N-acetyltransferase [Roseovarius sp. LXJ103]|uniref:GNAT family N-acetyltransferase n=1 Tax=Roseovarius carneus TaxID=2853164 RepID=UPI000D61A3F5|nr:GNAT family N-acetyltransferase [Roseovarius carneus]MBZ8118861.1 GNAT family N-acetyltransferase [Roseovarius carneus]PWE35477.1 GNAT family N-acetyltransferase [Pelagicola sp. LXJ1103]